MAPPSSSRPTSQTSNPTPTKTASPSSPPPTSARSAPPTSTFKLSDQEVFCIEEQDVLDRIYSLTRSFDALFPSSKFNLVDSLPSNLSVLLPNIDSPPASSTTLTSPPVSPPTATPFKSTPSSSLPSSSPTSLPTPPPPLPSPSVGRRRQRWQGVSCGTGEPHRIRVLGLFANSLEMNLSMLGVDDNYLVLYPRMWLYFKTNIHPMVILGVGNLQNFGIR